MYRFAASRRFGRILVVLVSLSIVMPSFLLPVAHAQESATLQGVILDPSGRPAPGFKVVCKDVVSGTEYTSTASGTTGEYVLQVPVGARYQLVNALAPDGTRLTIQAGVPLPVHAPGVYRRDVQFQLEGGAQVVDGAAPAQPTETAATAPPPPEERKDKAVPWWKTTGGIIGIVLGGGALIAIVAGGSGNSSSTPASPSAP
jgi:hypothetical protein